MNKTALKYFKNIGVFPAVSGAKKIIDNSSAKDFVQRRIALGGGRAGLILKGAAAVAKALKKLKPSKKMGGGMMNMPGYKKGKSVMAKGCKLGRKKPTKMYT